MAQVGAAALSGTGEPERSRVLGGDAMTNRNEVGISEPVRFFAVASGERWLAPHSEVRGYPITVPNAAAAAGTIFGDMFSAR